MPAEINFQLPLFSAGVIMIRKRRRRKTVMMYPYMTLADETEIAEQNLLYSTQLRSSCQFCIYGIRSLPLHTDFAYIHHTSRSGT